MHVLKTVVSHDPMPTVEFQGEGGEGIRVRFAGGHERSDDETLVESARIMMLHAAALDRPEAVGEANPDRAEPGTIDEKPRWEGPPENRPSGYLPAADDPDSDRDAAGENLRDPDKEDLSDLFATRDDK